MGRKRLGWGLCRVSVDSSSIAHDGLGVCIYLDGLLILFWMFRSVRICGCKGAGEIQWSTASGSRLSKSNSFHNKHDAPITLPRTSSSPPQYPKFPLP